MAKKSDTAFRRNQIVRSTVEMPGVAVGTEGRVLRVTPGFDWERYHVVFSTGRILGQIDPSKLEAS